MIKIINCAVAKVKSLNTIGVLRIKVVDHGPIIGSEYI